MNKCIPIDLRNFTRVEFDWAVVDHGDPSLLVSEETGCRQQHSDAVFNSYSAYFICTEFREKQIRVQCLSCEMDRSEPIFSYRGYSNLIYSERKKIKLFRFKRYRSQQDL